MTLYLSQLILNPRSRQVQAELRDPYQMHRTLSKAFDSDPEAWKAARVLFRVERADCDPRVLIQSRTPPDWSRLTVSDDYLAAKPLTKTFDPAIRKGQLLRFRLRANPTAKKIVDETVRDRNGRPKRDRVGLFGEHKQMEWLRRKANGGGFEILDCWISAKSNSRSVKGSGIGTITHLGITFDGILRVTDAELFASTLASGIGSAKAFGFGLLSVAPIAR